MRSNLKQFFSEITVHKKTKLKGSVMLIVEWIKSNFFSYHSFNNIMKSIQILLYTVEKNLERLSRQHIGEYYRWNHLEVFSKYISMLMEKVIVINILIYQIKMIEELKY